MESKLEEVIPECKQSGTPQAKLRTSQLSTTLSQLRLMNESRCFMHVFVSFPFLTINNTCKIMYILICSLFNDTRYLQTV